MESPFPFVLSPASLFYIVVGVAQMALASLIVTRQWRREWAWIVAGLFTVNAGYAFTSIWRTGEAPAGVGAWAARVGLYFDMVSFLLIAYLAMAYPTRPRRLQNVPWALAAVFGPLVAGVFVLNALHPLGETRNVGASFDTAKLLVGFVGPALVWSLLVTRWTRLWLRPLPTSLRRQFQFIFAAFAMRAANQLVATLNVDASPESDPLLVWAAKASNILALLVLLTCVAMLAWAQNRQAGAPRGQTFFILAFFCTGLVVGTLPGALGHQLTYYRNVFNHFDLYIVRPLLVWIAMSHHKFLGEGWRHAVVTPVLLWLLALAGFVDTVAPTIAGYVPGIPFLLATLLVSALLAFALLAAAWSWLLGGASDASGLAPGLQTYRMSLEEAYRNGEPGRHALRSLERQRDWLGIGPEQHAALLQDLQAVASSRAAASAAWTEGSVVVGRYKVRRLLGEGGVGEAYEAQDILAGHPVVLKRTRKLDAVHRRQLLREAEVMARVPHTHIVRLLRTEFAGDEPILVLEMMRGGSLQGRKAGRYPPARAVPIALDVLSALAEIHAAGLVHGDVKPANVLLDEKGAAKLSDLGAARPFAGSMAPMALGNATLPPVPTGTLRYMAPETLGGRHTDHRVDLYAVALLLQELLAGRNPVPAGPDFLVRKTIIEGKMPSLPTNVPASLRHAISRGLEKDPARRYPTATAFRHALREAMSGTPGSTVPRRRRHRLPTSAAGPSATAPS